MAAFLPTRPFVESLVQSWRRFAGRSGTETTAFVPNVQNIPVNDDLLCIRMQALGLDRTEVIRLWPGIMLDLRKNCIACDSRIECDAELKSISPEGDRSETQNWKDYCPNVANLNMLSSLLPAMQEVAPRLQSRDI